MIIIHTLQQDVIKKINPKALGSGLKTI
ncbi:protein of unknown function [Candidatus Nitrosotalea okcheonensis]|uniref:Uncharacterized protein n=1 Tax=Candidatus Nitrosotalea okcheonensis TaxID=1903276 RepID=A0A2H1FET9_9ARCH|nr:protein of unknown function [Candidatus Nitrosotalea okcheonensis]